MQFHYRAMHFSAERGLAIACRLSVCDVGDFSGNYYVKFRHFSDKNHANLGNFVNFWANIIKITVF